MLRTSRSFGGFAWIALATVVALVVPAAARADEADAKARAKQLFEEGMRAIERRDRVTGCAKLRESLSTFTVPNTLFNVADCDEHDGKFALAFEHWQRGVKLLDAKDSRVRVAKKRQEALEGRIARLRIVVPPKIASATILLDDVQIDAAALSEPIVVDIGEHIVVTRLEDHEDHRQQVRLVARDRTEIVVREGTVKKKQSSTKASKASTFRTGAVVAFGVGAAGGIAAAITGGLLLSRDEEIANHCNGFSCDRIGYDLARGQNSLLIGNAIAWGAGVVGVGTGVALMILSKRADKKESSTVLPVVSPSFAGLGLRGRF